MTNAKCRDRDRNRRLPKIDKDDREREKRGIDTQLSMTNAKCKDRDRNSAD